MRKAKLPPTPTVKALALAMLDLLESGWFSTELAAIVEIDQRLGLPAEELPGATFDERATTAVRWGTELAARRVAHAQQSKLLLELVEAGVAEWLRWHPRKRSDGRLYTYVPEVHRERVDDPEPPGYVIQTVRETHYRCVFCSADHATLAMGKHPKQPLIDRMNLHGSKCALRVLSWTTTPPKSVTKTDTKREGTRQQRRARDAAMNTAQSTLFEEPSDV